MSCRRRAGLTNPERGALELVVPANEGSVVRANSNISVVSQFEMCTHLLTLSFANKALESQQQAKRRLRIHLITEEEDLNLNLLGLRRWGS